MNARRERLNSIFGVLVGQYHRREALPKTQTVRIEVYEVVLHIKGHWPIHFVLEFLSNFRGYFGHGLIDKIAQIVYKLPKLGGLCLF